MYDLNGGKNPPLTIVKKFARESTNDMAQTFHLDTANIVMIEFKKYLFLTALRLKDDKEGQYKKIVNAKVYY